MYPQAASNFTKSNRNRKSRIVILPAARKFMNRSEFAVLSTLIFRALSSVIRMTYVQSWSSGLWKNIVKLLGIPEISNSLFTVYDERNAK